MLFRLVRASLLFASVAFIVGCDPSGQEKRSNGSVDRESLLVFNEEKARLERAFIDSLVAFHHDKSLPHYLETPTGLRIWTDRPHSVSNAFLEPGDTVQWVGQLMLTDSTLLVEWSADEPFQFLWNRSDWPSGFQEVAGLLRRGDAAQCLIPSHLGWGLTGMPPLIPQDAVLWLRIEQQSGPSVVEERKTWNDLLDKMEVGEFPQSDWIEAKSFAASPCLAWYDADPGLAFSAPPEWVHIDLRTLRIRGSDGALQDMGETSWDFNVNDGGQLLPVLADLHRLYPQPRKWACWCPVDVAFDNEVREATGFGPEDVVGFHWEVQSLPAPIKAQ